MTKEDIDFIITCYQIKQSIIKDVDVFEIYQFFKNNPELNPKVIYFLINELPPITFNNFGVKERIEYKKLLFNELFKIGLDEKANLPKDNPHQLFFEWVEKFTNIRITKNFSF